MAGNLPSDQIPVSNVNWGNNSTCSTTCCKFGNLFQRENQKRSGYKLKICQEGVSWRSWHQHRALKQTEKNRWGNKTKYWRLRSVWLRAKKLMRERNLKLILYWENISLIGAVSFCIYHKTIKNCESSDF